MKMVITQEKMEFVVLLLTIFGSFYKLTQIESRIKESIKEVQKAIELHVKDNELLIYQVRELQSILNDQQKILKNSGLLRRETD
ncbi:MAG: hypothetical protein RLZZ507_4381 [Cyanobacteriota bacterium]|jgi:hypothetical protein